MDFDKVLELLPAIWPVILLVVTTFIGPAFKAWLDAKIRNEKWEGAVKRATDAASTGVQRVAQTYVDAIKEGRADGKLSEEEKAEAKRLAKRAATEYLGDGYDLLADVFGGHAEADAYLDDKIEAAVRVSKAARPFSGASPSTAG